MNRATRLRWIALVIVVGFGAWWLWPAPAVRYSPGVLIPFAPEQQPIVGAGVWEHEGYTITPLASFSISARVLGKARYRLDREADLASYDLALGWQNMSDQAVLDTLSISQSNRWYRWRWSGTPPPISSSEITAQSANMHIIAANDDVRRALARIIKGDLVAFSGKLVRVDAGDGWAWQSSLTRTDDGDGACELVWVDTIEIMPRR